MQWLIVRLTRSRWRRLFMFFVVMSLIVYKANIWKKDIVKCKKCHPPKQTTLHQRTAGMQFDYRRFQNMTWKSDNVTSKPLLTLFTTWNPSMQKPVVHRNVLRNWQNQRPHIRTIVYTNNTNVVRLAKKYNWNIRTIRKTACHGTPVLRTMFQDTIRNYKSHFYGYSNADVLFNGGLEKTLNAILQSPMFSRGPLLIVGKRVDVNITRLNEPVVNNTRDVDQLARHGKLSWGFAGDYFITNNLLPWQYVPNVVIGRPLVDNWLVWYARKVGARVIDVSGTVLAVHQVSNGVKRFMSMCNKDEMLKHNLLPSLPIWKGMIECASFEARFDNNGNVFVLLKILIQEICKHNKVKFI